MLRGKERSKWKEVGLGKGRGIEKRKRERGREG